MAKRISELTAAGPLDGSELLECVQGGNSRQTAANALLPPGYIDGLKMVWVSGTALTVTSGAAYVPGLGKLVRAAADIAKTGLTLTASTWHHLYLYLDASSNPAVEVVTTAPSATYNGTARTKTGDTSRRYLGSVLADASGNIYKFLHTPGSIAWKTSVAAAPFLVISAGAATSPTAVSCSGAAPVTTTHATLIMANLSSNAVDAPIGTPDMSGTLSATNYLQYLAKGVQTTHVMPLDASQAFNYMLTGAPGSSGFYARVSGYLFER